jgi:uncharacterized protein YkwD
MLKRKGFLTALMLASCWIVLRAQTDYYRYTTDNFRACEAFNERVDTDNPDAARVNAVIFYLTNEERVKAGLPEVSYHPLLEESASLHCRQMLKYDFFDHVNYKKRAYRNPNDRGRAAGIENPYIAENLRRSFLLEYKSMELVYTGGPGEFYREQNGDPIGPHTYLTLCEVIVEGWMNSPPHKSNILSPHARQLGCGTAYYNDEKFNYMPTVLATQNFQLYEPIRTTR